MLSRFRFRSLRISFLVATTLGSLFTAGCSKPNSAPEAKSGDTQTETIFGNDIAFIGYTVQSNKDNHTEVELRWKALRTPSASYVVFVHALDSSGAIAFQGDHMLKNAAGLPPSSWAPGEAVSDRFSMIPPAGHSAGPYNLRVGLYTLNPIKVIQISQAGHAMPTDSWKDRSILLTGVECK
jgi:hypothetical protein